MVKAYVGGGLTIDSAFVGLAVMVFDRTFSAAATDYVNLFRKVLYWTDADDPYEALVPFPEQFNSTLTNNSYPILGQPETVALARKGDFTPVVILTKQHAATLRYLRRQLPGLKGRHLPADRDFLLTTMTGTGPLLVISIRDRKRLAGVAELLRKQGRLEAGLREP